MTLAAMPPKDAAAASRLGPRPRRPGRGVAGRGGAPAAAGAAAAGTG